MAPNPRTLFWNPTPDQIAQAADTEFRQYVNAKRNLNMRDYWELHKFSCERQNDFWIDVWEYCGVIGERTNEKLLFDNSFPMDKPNPNMILAKMNWSENILLSHVNARSYTAQALVSVVEPEPSLVQGDVTKLTPKQKQAYLDSTLLRSMTFGQVYDEVRALSRSLKEMGVKSGDRVAAFAPSNAEMVVGVLATGVLGAIWSSCPCEFGVKAVLERLTQIEPKVLFTADTFRYAQKEIPVYPKLLEVLASLPSVTSVIVVGHLAKDRKPKIKFPVDQDIKKNRKWMSYVDVVKHGDTLEGGKKKDIEFYKSSAMDPIWVLYSSGTTGQPKPIVHSIGGMILSSKMTNTIHSNLNPSTVMLQFSTLGWMMWNYACSMLGVGGSVVMYDGSPLSPQPVLWQLVERYKVTALGVSPRYLQVLDTAGYVPNQHSDLSSLESISTAGSVLKAELYDWMRDKVNKNVWIHNGTGGTDICNLFIGGVKSLPTYHAEITAPGLGMDLQSWDDDGKPIYDTQGNMVITKPFPNAPIGFWNDHDGKRYKSAYYEEYPKPVWYQGDWIEVNSLTRGVTVFGRSDGVLNPQGVRFGSAELYSVVEEMRHIVDDCIAVGQKLPDGDERVILFVKPKSDKLTPEVIKEIREGIRAARSSRHVPAKVIDCPRIPYTTNGKRLEVAAKKLVNGVPISKINLSSAEDPKVLEFFANHPELELTAVKAKL